jgi:hypothetical protein
VDASFLLDIYLNFRTGYLESEPAEFLVTSVKSCAVRYLRGSFLLDFLATVPWDIVLSNDNLGVVQLVKLSKLTKLLRMARALKLIRILRLVRSRFLVLHTYSPNAHGLFTVQAHVVILKSSFFVFQGIRWHEAMASSNPSSGPQ